MALGIAEPERLKRHKPKRASVRCVYVRSPETFTGASLTGATDQSVKHGTDCTVVTAVAPTGFVLVDWTLADGSTYSTDNPLTVTKVVSNMELTANLQRTVVFVNWAANGAATGESWSDAFRDLSFALSSAVSGQEIWVARGTYPPTFDYELGIGDVGMHFRLKNGVAIFGGFEGNEQSRSARDPKKNETILSCELGEPDNDSDNCFHVLFHPQGINLDKTAQLHGFTISHGRATGDSVVHTRGAGMYNEDSNPTITDCTFKLNSAKGKGGGMFNLRSNPKMTNCIFDSNIAEGIGGGMFNLRSNPTIMNSTFQSNSTTTRGGGMSNFRSSPEVTNCVFDSNTAGGKGGGIHNEKQSSPTVTNCVFLSNAADDDGGGISNIIRSNPMLTNCTFTMNSAQKNGGGMFNQGSSTRVTNSVFWKNQADGNGNEVFSVGQERPLFNNCDIKDSEGVWVQKNIGIDAGGNIDLDPAFIDANAGNLALETSSPCIDTGDNAPFGDTGVAANVSTDLAHNPRIVRATAANAVVDMGAYEYQP